MIISTKVPQPDKEKGRAVSASDIEAVKRIAKATWEEMHSERGVPYSHNKHGDGVCIDGAVSHYIRKVSKRTGATPSDEMIDVIRKFLRVTGNVVVMGEIKPRIFTIFVASTWKDVSAVVPVGSRPPDAIDHRASRLSPEEAGETRTPEPVIVKNMADHNQPMSEQQVLLLMALRELGPVSDKSGQATRVLAEAADLIKPGEKTVAITSALHSLEKRGLVERKTKGKRTYRIALTFAGAAAAERAEDNLPAKMVVAKYLSRVGVIECSPGELGRVIGNALNMPSSRAASALRDLESDGVVKRWSKSSGGMPYKAEWVGPVNESNAVRVAAPTIAPEPQTAPALVPPPPPAPPAPPTYQRTSRWQDRTITQEPEEDTVAVQTVSDLIKPMPMTDLLRQALTQAEKIEQQGVASADCETRLSLVRDVVSKIEAGHMTLFDGFQEIRAALS